MNFPQNLRGNATLMLQHRKSAAMDPPMDRRAVYSVTSNSSLPSIVFFVTHHDFMELDIPTPFHLASQDGKEGVGKKMQDFVRPNVT